MGYTRRRNSRPSLMNLTKPLLKCPAINFSFFCLKKIVKLPLDYFNILQSRTDLCHSFYNSFCRIVRQYLLISTTALHKLLVTLPAPTHQKNHLISRAGQPLSWQLKTKKLCHHFLILANAKFQKISSVTVFTEVVAMIFSFHRDGEKKKRTKNHENKLQLLKKISIESKVQKHSEFISILLSLAKLSIA